MRGLGFLSLVAQWYPVPFFFGSGFPYKITNTKKGCPYYNVVAGLPSKALADLGCALQKSVCRSGVSSIKLEVVMRMAFWRYSCD